jgi:hypothetical protein
MNVAVCLYGSQLSTMFCDLSTVNVRWLIYLFSLCYAAFPPVRVIYTLCPYSYLVCHFHIANHYHYVPHNCTRHVNTAHQMAEDYIDLASNLMLYPTSQLGPYGYSNSSSQQYPLQSVSALGYLKGSFRRPTVIEQWSPYEIAVFEAALGKYGKDFLAVQKEISTSKSCRQVIDFYYIWKKTSHYERWKKSYEPPHMDVSLDDSV